MKNRLAWKLAGEDEQIYEALVAALEGEARMARDMRIYTRYATTARAPTGARADRQTPPSHRHRERTHQRSKCSAAQHQ